MKARAIINASVQSPANARLLKDALELAWNKIPAPSVMTKRQPTELDNGSRKF